MLKTNEDIIELINKSFVNPIIKIGEWRGGVTVKFKGSTDQCTFAFRTFEDNDPYCAEWFKGHLCLSFGAEKYHHNSGLGFMEVADEEDLSSEIIEFIESHLNAQRRKEEEVKYIQMSIFDFTY